MKYILYLLIIFIILTVLGKDSFVLRIINRKTALRALIKGFTGSIEDVAFAHYNSNVLACTDSAGDIFVWTIYEENDRIKYPFLLP